MHLPAAIRRRIVYVTAATLLAGSLALAAGPVQHTQTAAEDQPPATTAPASAPDTQDSQRIANSTQVPAASKADAPAPAKTEEQARPKVTTYTVVEGDTVGGIAERFGLEATTVLWANDLAESDYLQIDQELQIPSVDGIIHTVQSGDILWEIALEYDVNFAKIAEANPDIDAEALQPGQVLLVPGGQPVMRRAAAMVASRGGEREPSASGSLGLWPVSGPITDSFGWRTHPVYGTPHYHDGIDIGVSSGTPVVSVAQGTVSYVGYLGGYGLTIKVDHGDGVVTMYSHMDQATVEPGQSVGGGEQVGLSGNTGTTTGPHLHFSLFVGGSPVDPIGWLP